MSSILFYAQYLLFVAEDEINPLMQPRADIVAFKRLAMQTHKLVVITLCPRL